MGNIKNEKKATFYCSFVLIIFKLKMYVIDDVTNAFYFVKLLFCYTELFVLKFHLSFGDGF